MGHIITANRLAVGLSSVALMAAAGGGTYALAAGGARTITVCVKTHGGSLYKASKCSRGDRKLSWNSIGPQGPAGARGLTGADGAMGPAGAAGRNGTNGTDGTNGTNGADGTDGTNGTDGANGIGATVATINIPVGTTDYNAATMGEVKAYVECTGSGAAPEVVVQLASSTGSWEVEGSYSEGQFATSTVGFGPAAATRSELVTQAGNGQTTVVPGQQAVPGYVDQVAGSLQIQDTSTRTDYTLIFNLYAESDSAVVVTSACSGTATVIPTASAG